MTVPLVHPDRAIKVIGAILVKSMAVKTSSNVVEMIVDCEDESVAIVQINLGRRPPAVDTNDPSLVETIGIGRGVCDIPFERLNSGEHRPGQAADHDHNCPTESGHFFQTVDVSEKMAAEAILTGRPKGGGEGRVRRDDRGPQSDRTTP